jgi:hypothetical protein
MVYRLGLKEGFEPGHAILAHRAEPYHRLCVLFYMELRLSVGLRLAYSKRVPFSLLSPYRLARPPKQIPNTHLVR